MRVFISYAHSDKEYANKIEDDLKKQYINIWMDKKSIDPGKIWLQEIDNGLYQVDYVLGIVTDSYLESTGGIEAYAKIAQGLQIRNIEYIPLFFIPIKKVKSVLITAIQGFNFAHDYDDGLSKLLKFLKEKDLEKPKDLLGKIEGDDVKSPFRRVRAEQFKNDYNLLARAFTEPQKAIYEAISGSLPVFLFGGRGSGKTMILKSLTPEVAIPRLNTKSFKDARKRGLDFFGVYFKLRKGSLSIYDSDVILRLGFYGMKKEIEYDLYKQLWNDLEKNRTKHVIISTGLSIARTITLNELNFKILKKTLQKLIYCLDTKNRIIEIPPGYEETIAKKIGELIDFPLNKKVNSFNDLVLIIEEELRKIINYLQNLTIPFSGDPDGSWNKTGIDFLDNCFNILTSRIEELNETPFYLLFDEYENLLEVQQEIVNQWVKTANNFVVKVASKYEGMYTNRTREQNQSLQFGQDCRDFYLDYDLFDQSSKEAFQTFLVKLCYNLLSIEDFKEKDIRKILEEPKTPEIPQVTIDCEIEQIRSEASLKFDPKKIEKYRNTLGTATIFRLLRKKEQVEGRISRQKIYAGFNVYTYLSSGIIRIFLNLVGMAFYRAEELNVDIRNGQTISVQHQSWAARIVSQGWLDKIPTNIPEYGEIMYQFIVDLGDIFRTRLLYHSSEPEMLSFSIDDPSNLQMKKNHKIKNILHFGVRESVFYKREPTAAQFPRTRSKTRTRTYVLNRVYTPVLELSYRAIYGRFGLSTNDLTDLLNFNKKEKVKIRLLQAQRMKSDDKQTPLTEFITKDNYEDGINE